MAEGHAKGLLGWHEISIGADGVHEQTEHNESHQSWSAVERVVEDDKYIFIYIQPLAAHVIPKTAFDNPDAAGAFVKHAHALHGAASK
jgi:hypothetical protein